MPVLAEKERVQDEASLDFWENDVDVKSMDETEVNEVEEVIAGLKTRLAERLVNGQLAVIGGINAEGSLLSFIDGSRPEPTLVITRGSSPGRMTTQIIHFGERSIHIEELAYDPTGAPLELRRPEDLIRDVVMPSINAAREILFSNN